MAADWRITVVIDNASGVPVADARLTRRLWSGGAVQLLPEITIGPSFTFDVPGETRNIVCELRHRRYATLVMNLVRDPGETGWRWTNATRRVRTDGQQVTIAATLGRVRPAPLGHLPEADLTQRAQALKPLLEEAERKNAAAQARKRNPTEPNYVPLDLDHRTALVTQDRRAHRTQAAISRTISGFRLAGPALLSDTPEAPGWGRFATTSHTIDPDREGRFHLVEYGEVGEGQATGPRFAIGVWVPHRLHQPKTAALDFVVWLHPHTNNRLAMPQAPYPFRPPYPYGLLAARGRALDVVATQRFLDIPVFHLLSQHFLAYQLAAAQRDAIIVIPIVPSSQFELFEAPASLMRLLRELCLWMPRDFPRGAEATVHAPAPVVRRVVVSGFSASVPRLHTLMNAGIPDAHYAAPEWWASPRERGLDDAADFRRVWKEQWAVDGISGGFQAYADAAATWVQQQSDRRIRIYKSEHTGGWDPLGHRSGAWAALVRGAKPVRRESGKVWAMWAGDPQGPWLAASFANAFVLGPGSGPEAAIEPQLLPTGAHELMPRICFGHAAATSGLATGR
ncbi:hypothetical protein [Nonomuraea sp. SBT364]|uniref:hypothetical protein n=1 Tax=Nonomuraea sp. SBT364 TaxID=1580530 RepID=UPI00066D34BB|nr:hypothetical protein [Nonomuraea sp. SBT364]